MAYISINKAHTHHQTTINGQPTNQYSRYETGLITGNKRNLPAILADNTGSDGYGFDSAVGSDDDSWHVLNAFDKRGSYIDTIAVGGAMDSDHAVVVAQTQLDSLGAASVALIGTGLTQFDSLNRSDAGTFSIDAINKLMDNPSQDKNYLPIITASELAYEADRVTFDSVQWGENSNELLSHDGRDSSLMLDMTRADTRNDLVNEFELADVLDLLGAEPEQSFDALMDTKNRLGLLKDRLYNAMSRAGNDTVSVTSVTETKPFKRQGVTNIAFVFDLSDSQKLSIWFHNPDSTPSKLMPSDIMISWKWMLNKRDVTAALSPKQGDNVQLPVLASRIMRVAAKNSMRFKRTQARQLKLEQDLLEAQALVDTKVTTIEQLDKDIESLTSQIDAAMKAPKIEPVVEPVNKPVIETSVVDDTVVEPASQDEKWPTGLSESQKTSINALFDADFSKQSDEVLAMLLLMHNHSENGIAKSDESNIVGATQRLFQTKDLNKYYLDGGAGELSEATRQAYESALQELNNIGNKPREFLTFIFNQSIEVKTKLAEVDTNTGVYGVDALTGITYITAKNEGDGQYSTVIKNLDSEDEIFGNLAKNQRFILNFLKRVKMSLSSVFLSEGVDVLGIITSDSAKKPEPASQEIDTDNPILELKGNELGEFEESPEGKKQLRAAAKDEFNRLRGEWIACPSLSAIEGENAKVEIRKRGIKEFMAFSGDSRKLKLVAKIAEIIKTASLPANGWQDNEKMDKKRSSSGYYHLENTIMLDGELISLKVVIEKDNNGLLHYDVIIPKNSAQFDGIKKSERPVLDNYSRGDSDNLNITIDDNDVNQFDNVLETAIPNNYSGVASSTLNIKATNDEDVNQDQAMFDKADLATEGVVLNMFILNDNSLEEVTNNDDSLEADGNQARQAVIDFAKTHAGFGGFIESNNDAETALAGKAKGDWVVSIHDDQSVTVFMALDNDSSYTGASDSDIKSAYNDIFEKTKNAAERWGTDNKLADINSNSLPAGYDVGTATNNEVIKDPRIQALIADLGLTLVSSDNNEYEYGTKTDNSAFSFKLKNGELSTVYFVQNSDGSNLNNAMTEVDDINGFIAQAKDMHAKYLELLGDDNTPDSDNTPTNPNNKKITKGKSNKAKTPKGTKIESVFALVDAKFLIASHTANGSKNPKYPQELQPRDRARESSIAWVQKTSRELDPESLGRTGRVDTGAPIVGDDLVVESGNGRTIAIKMAYANGDAGEYREWLIENADMFGMTAQQVESYKQPILVRVRTTDVNRSEFAVEANQDDKLSFTASERAKSDAKRVNAGMLELFDPSESGDILAASNRDFVKSFLASLGATEAAQYTDSNGNPTQALVARIKGALFSKAYDDDRLLEMMADQTKPELQNTLNALTMAAPNFVAAQAVNRSDAQDLAEKVVDSVEQSLSDEVKNAIVDATNMIMNARISKQDIKEYVLQQGLFEQVDDSVAELAVFLAANARSAKKMTDYFNAMASYIEQDSVSRQNLDMFGEPEPLSLADVIAHANSKANDNTDTIGTLDMFNETAVDETIAPEPVAEPTNPLNDFNDTDLATKVDDMVNEINSNDFDAEKFDVDALSAIADEAAGNSELTAKLEEASEVYQNKLIAIAMQAMSDMVGN